MASIDKRRDGKYRVRWREYPGGPQRARHFQRKAEAQLFADGVRGDLARGVYIDPGGGRTLFRDYAEMWRAAQVHANSTESQVETYLRLHAYPILGNRPLGAVRRTDVQGWVKSLDQKLAPGSVELAYRWVSTIFKAAVDDRLIPSSPCSGITLPRRDHNEVVPPTTEEVMVLADAVPDRYRALIVLAAGTGLRQGECFGLTIDRIDPPAQVSRKRSERVSGMDVRKPSESANPTRIFILQTGSGRSMSLEVASRRNSGPTTEVSMWSHSSHPHQGGQRQRICQRVHRQYTETAQGCRRG